MSHSCWQRGLMCVRFDATLSTGRALTPLRLAVASSIRDVALGRTGLKP